MSSRELIGFSKEQVCTHALKNLVSTKDDNHKTKSVKWKDKIWEAKNSEQDGLQI